MAKVHSGLARGYYWVALFVGVILALVAGRYEYCQSETERIRTAKHEGIEVISKLKTQQIQEWSREQRTNLWRCSKAPVFAKALGDRVPDFNYTAPQSECYDEKSLTHDLAERDRLRKVQDLSTSKMSARWGPRAFKYPAVVVPEGCDPVKWKRLKVIAVAKRYIGLPYRRHHVPDWESGNREGPGLDCSNFTSWVYNYGLGISFPSNILAQSDGPRAPGRKLKNGESFEPGDLLFITRKDRSRISHVVIFVDTGHIVDSHGSGVQVRAFEGWYKSHFSHARRIIE